MLKIVYSVVIIIGFASTALAIRCYSCDSLQHKDCAETFNNSTRFVLDCGTTANGCLHIKNKPAQGIAAISRECYANDPKEACRASSYQISCFYCTSDLCNSSTTTGAFAAIVMLLAVIVRMMS